MRRVRHSQLANLQPVLLRQPIEPSRPAFAPSDDGRFDKQTLPLPRRTERSDTARRVVVRRSGISVHVLVQRRSYAGCANLRERRRLRQAMRPACRWVFQPLSSEGTCASERYSAKRRAEKPSTAQLSMARNARPPGCGRLSPDRSTPGTSARDNACSNTPTYCWGERMRIAISSNRTPLVASFRMRRAISTHSRPSPGAENQTSSPVRSRSGGGRRKTGGAQVASDRCRRPARPIRLLPSASRSARRASVTGRKCDERARSPRRGPRETLSPTRIRTARQARGRASVAIRTRLTKRPCCRFEQRSPVAGVRFGEKRLNALEQLGEIRSAARQPPGSRCHPSVEARAACAPVPSESQVCPPPAKSIEHFDPWRLRTSRGRQGPRARGGGRRLTTSGEVCCRQPRGELCERQAVQAECCAGFNRDRAREIVNGPP